MASFTLVSRTKVFFVVFAILLGSFLFFSSASAASPTWNITGVWNLVFTVGITNYPHTMTVSSFNTTTGVFSGTGVYDVDPSYTWDVNGTVSGDSIAFHVLYTGTNAGYQFDATGTIAGDGLSMAGAWDSGTWTGTGAAAQLPLYVDDNLVECPDAQYSSIQAAVDVAVSGGQVIVCAGTYYETVTASKPITVTGNPGSVLDPDDTGAVNNDGFVITSGDVSIEGFKIIDADDPIVAVFIGDMLNIVIKNNEIDCTECEGSGGTEGIAFTAIDITGSPDTYNANGAIVEGNIIKNNDKNAIVFDGVYGSFSIKGNTIDNTKNGIGFSGCDNALQCQRVTDTGTELDGNVIQNLNDVWSWGILFAFVDGDVLVTGNTVIIQDLPGPSYQVALQVGSGFFEWFGYTCPGGGPYNCSYSTGIVAHHNNFIGSGGAGVFNKYDIPGTTDEVNAEDNWWGACSGPGPIGPGSGTLVTTNVDFIPWSIDRCGTLIIVKDAIPDDAQDFDFTSSFGPFSLDDDADPVLPNSQTFTPLEPGVYSVIETVPLGWDLTSAMCDDGSPPGAIGLDPSETVTCTFTNTKKGKIIIEKQTLPDADPQVFLFGGDVGGILGDGQTAEQVVVPGMYASREEVPPGWDLTSIICDDQDSFGDLPIATAIFNVAPGETVTCVFTNTKRGKLVVNKTTYPAHDPQVFAIEASGTGIITGGGLANVTHDSSHTYDVTPGTYSVVETVPAGWMMISNTCNNKVVGPGQNKSCIIKNKKISRLTVEKTTVGGMGTFDFTGDVGSFQLTTTQPGIPVASFFDVFVDINGSNLTVNETVPAGWIPNPDPATCTVNLKPGEQKMCSFVNTKAATLKVIKKVINDNGGTKQVADFPLFINDSPTMSGTSVELAPGNYIVSETNQPGYAVSFSGACDAGGNVVLNPGDVKTCIITNNDQFGSISGVKFDDKNANGTRDLGEPGLPGWIIYIDANNNGSKNPGEPFRVTGANGNYKFVGLLAGTYIIREVLKPNWIQSHPASGKHTVVLSAEQEVKGRNFGNYKPGKIMGMKFEDKNNNGQKDPGEPFRNGWVITLKQNGQVVGSPKTTANGGKYQFTNLAPGLYEVSEALKPGWIQTFPGGAGIHQADVQSGQTSADVDFGNFKLGVIKGQKFNDKNGNGVKNGTVEPGLPGWTINLINLGNGQQQSAVTGAGGNYAFGGLMSGNYMLWEQLQPFWIPINPPGGVYQQITITTSGQVIQRSFGNKNALPNLQ